MLKSISLFARAAVLAAGVLLIAAQTSEAQHRGHVHGGRGIFLGGGGWWPGNLFGMNYGPGFFGPGYIAGTWPRPGGYPSPYLYGSGGYSQPNPVFVSVNVSQNTYNSARESIDDSMDKPGSIEVRVPANAQLWFNGRLTKQTGEVRLFNTPPLNDYAVQSYDLRAVWTDASGAEVIRTQKAVVAPNMQTVVNFAGSSSQ